MRSLLDIDGDLQRQLSGLVGRLAVKAKLQSELAAAQAKKQRHEEALAEIEEASIIISTVEGVQQSQLREKVEKLLTYGLSTIFDQDYKFVLNQTLRGNQTETEFCVVSSGTCDSLIPLKDAHGGGLVEVSSFLLQFIIMVSTRPALRSIMFLDEPFSMVSDEYRLRLGQFLRQLAERSHCQFVIVTHDEGLLEIADQRYRFKRVDGVTRVETLTSVSSA